MKKRVVSLLLVAMMVVTMMAGCKGKDDGTTSTPTGGASKTEGGNTESGAPMTLELWTSNRDALENKNAWYVKKIEEEFNVKIEMKYRNEGAGDYAEWLTLAMAGNDAPDWFRDQAVNLTTLTDYVKQGLVAELNTEMVKENMPNYMAWTQKYSNIFGDDPFSIYAVDGKVYSIPDAKVDLTKFCLMAYRQDWLDKLSLKVPETQEEFTEVMRAFTFDDPDGNGVKDTYGYIGITGNADWAFSPIFAAYGTYPGLWYAKEDGTITRGEIEPATKEALKYIKELYDMGVIDPEWMTIDFEQAKNKVVSSVVGCSWQNWLTILTVDGWWSALKEAEPNSGWAVTTGIVGKNGDQGVMQFNPLAGVGLVFSKHMEQQPEKIAKYLQVFDAIAGDPAWHEAEIWGVEGETYTINENGDRQYTDAYADEGARVKYGITAAYRFPTLEQFQYDPEVHDSIDYTAELNGVRAKTLDIIKGKYDILGNFKLPVWADVSAELPDMNVIFAEMITGERSIDEFDAVVQEWMDKGGKEALEEAQQLYNERFQ
ncbi:putative aldouronate transport system substrate-binding protein [Anaerotaenia torta]|uniref:extracellular solute-binding protein n=1 Tax=Anaerotaenia torta TaxID=433293 RepID=UPI003D221C87